MIFVPLLHYFKNKNSFSGNEDGMRYLLTPGKRKVPDPEGGEGESRILLQNKAEERLKFRCSAAFLLSVSIVALL